LRLSNQANQKVNMDENKL